MREIAEHFLHHESRQELLDIARRFEKLAAHADEKKEPPAAGAELVVAVACSLLERSGSTIVVQSVPDIAKPRR